MTQSARSLAVPKRNELRSHMDRAGRGPAARSELEHLMADVAAEILLLEVDLRRVQRALLRPVGPRVQPPDTGAQRHRQAALEEELAELRALAAEIRERLRAQG